MRSDQRAYAIHALRAFPALLDLFPVRNAPGQSARLIGISLITSQTAPYHLSDFFLFGRTGDMGAFWSMPLDTLNMADVGTQHMAATTFEKYTEFYPERYLMTEYLRRMTGVRPEYSIRGWLATLANRLIVIDYAQLDLYWPKYWPHEERPDLQLGASRLLDTPLTFLDWLHLQAIGEAMYDSCDVIDKLNPQSKPPMRVSDLVPGNES